MSFENSSAQGSSSDPLMNLVFGAKPPKSKPSLKEKAFSMRKKVYSSEEDDDDFFGTEFKEALKEVWKCKSTRQKICKELPGVYETMKKFMDEWGSRVPSDVHDVPQPRCV